MTSPEESPAPFDGVAAAEVAGTLALEPAPENLEEAPSTEAAGKGSGGPSTYSSFDQCTSGDKDGKDELMLADEMLEAGSRYIEEENYSEAAECLSRALEVRVEQYGELAPECSVAYYKYGCALLYKAQEEADPLGNVPKASQAKSATSATVANSDKDTSSRGSATNDKRNGASSKTEDEGDGELFEGDEASDGGSDDEKAENLAEGDEDDDSDLDLAWKMLDIARVIVERRSENTMEKVNIFSALGEVSMEREDFETSLNDYKKALSILENLMEPDHRRVVELNFRICMVLEVGSKIEDAIPYCEKAISLCKSRLLRLKEMMSRQTLTDGVLDFTSEEKEIETIAGFQTELEKKLEDLQQYLSNPKAILSEYLKMASAKLASGEKNHNMPESRSQSFASSQVGTINGCFDLPTISSAATNGSSRVTDLGVVGRGVKRATIAPIADDEPSTKKTLLDLSENSASSAFGVCSSTKQDNEATKK